LAGRGWYRGLVALAVLATATSVSRAGYEITDLGALSGGAGTSQGSAVNAGGFVTGSATTNAGETHGFLYNPATGELTDLGSGPGGAGAGTAVNAGGTVVGSATVAGGQTHAFKFASGQATDLGSGAGSIGSYANGINDSGVIVGTSILPQGVTHAFAVDTLGKVNDLGTFGAYGAQANGINASGVVVGSVQYSSGVTHAYRVVLGGGIQDLGGLSGANSLSYGLAINNAGEVVGYGGTADSPRAFRTLPDGTMQDLGTLPGSIRGEANAVNNFGQIVGTSVYNAGASQAFYFSDRTGLFNLSQSLVNGQGWDVKTATGINDFGQITGNGVYNGAAHAFLLTPVLTAVPEPSSLLLTGLGFLGLLAIRVQFRCPVT